MTAAHQADHFLSQYDEKVCRHALELREILLANLPDITEQVDIPARMVAYCYGQRYVDMICTIIPSKKGIKLGFHKEVELSDPHQLLEGTGKVSRYVVIKSSEQIHSAALKQLLKAALKVYEQRIR